MKEKRYELPKRFQGRFDALLKEILESVRPTKKEAENVTWLVNEIMGRLTKATPKNVEILLVGSVARGTQVRGSSDVDIFLLFPRDLKKEQIEKKGMEIAKSIVQRHKNEKYQIKYAEHPYVRLIFNDIGIEVDIVPAYKIVDISEKNTAVDRTQLHNEFVNSKLSTRERNDVRILKTFLNAHGIYGAEARVEGFSGYLCELLVYHYGSFLGVITDIANMELPLVLRPSERKELDTKEAQRFVKHFNSRFVVIDPTDSNRNVAANVSNGSLARFALASRALLREPRKERFYRPGFSDSNSISKIKEVRKKLLADLFVIQFKLPEMAEDILWQQLKKLGCRILDALNENGFATLLHLQNIKDDMGVLAFFIPDTEIKSSIVEGPSALMADATEGFMESHKRALLFSLSDDSIFTIERTKHSKPKELMLATLKDRKTAFPSYLNRKSMKLFVNTIPESLSKILYEAYFDKTTL